MSAPAVDQFTADEVRRIAGLARLDLSGAEAAKAATELSAIVRHINKLAEMDLDGVEPLRSVHGAVDVLREDAPGAGLSNDEALANAPASEAGCFQVPQII